VILPLRNTVVSGCCTLLVVGVLALLVSPLQAADTLTIPVSSGDEIPIERHSAKGNTLVIWTPSDFGVQPPQTVIAEQLARSGVEVWIADLHSAYFVPTGRYSSNNFPESDIARLVDVAIERGKSNIIFSSSGRASRLVLRAARQWQQNNKGKSAIRGFILFHPSLYLDRPRIGEDASYLPIVDATNLPIYIFQPMLATTYMRLPELRKHLSANGSQVFIHPLPNVAFGFHLRPDDMINENDVAARKKLPGQMAGAVRLLLMQPRVTAASKTAIAAEPKKRIVRESGLKPIAKSAIKPKFSLKDLFGADRDLEQYRGKVVLVNFWASWCPPCVEEMPSMQRLYGKLKGRPFEILAINVGEKAPAIIQFLKTMNIGFPVLLDPTGEVYHAWKVYVYPTNFLIDAKGRIRYGSYGAINWDEARPQTIIESLLDEAQTG
jgi:thiol-disulfide isomerase/thioredoxin